VRSWRYPDLPHLPGTGPVPRIWNTASGRLDAADPGDARADAGLYVCGITPYDSTHIGHAATYLAYDILIRLWLDAGLKVTYVQNTTDVDDPLLERATATGVSWRALADDQTERFRRDMERLSIIPPDHYIAVTERVDAIAAAVDGLLARDIAYRVGDDVYFDSATAGAVSPWQLGDESHYDRELMLTLSAERGGDPARPGKRDALDPVLWRGKRDGEPSWPSVVGEGRPGWHIECAVISAEFLHLPFTVNGGGEDLIFPHHEFTAGHAAAITGSRLAAIHSHAGLIAYQGEKMSKSLGNLVFVSELVESGVDARAVRLAILDQRYRDDWEWTDSILAEALSRLERWTTWAADAIAGESPELLGRMRTALREDLDTQAAIGLVDATIASGVPATAGDLAAIEALLGVDLS
jgi:L-cysteine:1D-myo-inositol 2-amino-2-deoxy-alpha-D-glucopyranoside ligase